MSARSPSRTAFTRGRLVVGLVLVALVGAGLAFGLSRLRGGQDPGRVVYATDRGVFVRELASGSTRSAASLPRNTIGAWPDAAGRWLAYLRETGDLWLLDLESKNRWRISERLTVGLGWSPDGRFVAGEFSPAGDLVAIDPEGRGPDLLVSGFRGGTVVWRDDDRFLTSMRHMYEIRVSGDRPLAKKLADDAWPVAVSPDGAEVLYSSPLNAEGRLFVAHLGRAGIEDKRTVHEGISYVGATSPEGVVAFSDLNGTWVLRGGSRPPLLLSRDRAALLGWSRDGASVLYIDIAKSSLYARELSESRTIRLSPAGADVKGFSVVP